MPYWATGFQPPQTRLPGVYPLIPHRCPSAGSTVLVGTWTVSDADKNEKPSAGTSEVTVIFKPDNANYDSVSVQASLTVVNVLVTEPV